jgi:hypothetical protein
VKLPLPERFKDAGDYGKALFRSLTEIFRDVDTRIAGVSGGSVTGLADIASSGSASDLIAGTVPAAQMPALTGDVTTSAGAVATTIGANKVTVGMLAQVATGTVLGRSAVGTGNVSALTTIPTATMPALTGDVTTAAGAVATTLATVNSNVGSFSKATITVNAKGLVTAASAGSVVAADMPALTGDVTTSAGAVATTLATVNSNVGSFTNASITVNAKGLVTAASTGTSTNPVGYIRGGLLTYNSTTAIDVSACTVDLNGTQYAISAATFTSGSTMKDIANSTVTIGASKAYWVFAYNNSGTGAFRIEEIDGTGDGAALVYDATLDYWKAASTGVNARRIGKFWTNGSSQIIKFWQHQEGDRSRVTTLIRTAVALLTSGTSSTYASVTITPYISADDQAMLLHIKPGISSGTNATCNTFVSVDAGTSDATVVQGMVPATGTTMLSGPTRLVNTASLYYKTTATNGTASIDLSGFSQVV